MNKLIQTRIFIVIIGAVLFFSLGIVSTKAYTSIKENSPSVSLSVSKAAEEENVKAGLKTKIAFIRYYTSDNTVGVTSPESNAPYMGKDEKWFSETYPDWKTVKFTCEEITLEKTIDSFGPESFLLSTATDEGSVERLAVYTYDKEGNRVLYWMYDTPTELYEANELEKLRKGISVHGKTKLNELLENYEE